MATFQNSSASVVLLVLAITLALIVSLLVLARRLFLVLRIVSNSMEPYLMIGERILVLRHTSTNGIKRGQIVAFRIPELDNRIAVKRVAALPGELYAAPPDYDDEPPEIIRIPPGHIFVLREGNIGTDSRALGPIPSTQIVGVMAGRFTKAGFQFDSLCPLGD